jgi:hypothetical protein
MCVRACVCVCVCVCVRACVRACVAPVGRCAEEEKIFVVTDSMVGKTDREIRKAQQEMP